MMIDFSGDVSSERAAEGALFGAILVFGINYPLLKALLAGVPPNALNALRFTASVLAMALMFRRRITSSLQRILEHKGFLLGLAFLGYFVSPVLLLKGMEYSSASNAAIILAGSPVWTAVLSWFLDVERIGPKGWFGLVVSTMGLIMVTFPVDMMAISTERQVGNLLLLADSVCWGSYVALQKNLIDRVGPFETSFWSLVVILPLFYLVSLGSVSLELIVSLSWMVWLGILFSGIFSMGLAHLWWNIGVQILGPTTVSVYSNGIPLVSVLIGWFLLGEIIGVRHLAGGFILLLGVWLARTDRIDRGKTKLGNPES